MAAQLMERLRAPLPGLEAQMLMAPQPRPGTERILDPNLECRSAGVLVLLYPGKTELQLVLTRRSESVNSHQGQISFPGGATETGETSRDAAVREAWEELAIRPETLTLLGKLSPLYIPPSGFCIYPTVAYTDERPDFLPSPDEVAEVIEVPVAQFLAPRTRRVENWQRRGQPTKVPLYQVGPHKVWGATAMVLCELASLLVPLPSAQHAPTENSHCEKPFFATKQSPRRV